MWETRLTPHADPASILVRPIREIDAGFTIGFFTRPPVVLWWRYLTLTLGGPYELLVRCLSSFPLSRTIPLPLCIRAGHSSA